MSSNDDFARQIAFMSLKRFLMSDSSGVQIFEGFYECIFFLPSS